MNYVEQRLAKIILTPEKYTENDLHHIQTVLCFIRDCLNPDEKTPDPEWIDMMELAENFLKKFVYCREMGIPITYEELKKHFGID